MLKRPDDWDNIEGIEVGNGAKLPPGPYACRITIAYAKSSQKGNPMLVLELDVDQGEYVSFFSNRGKSAVFRQLTEGKSMPYFKGLIDAIEASNPGYKFDFDPKSLINRRCCAVFGEEQFIGNDGGIAVATKIMYITTLQRLSEGDIQTPQLKKVNRPAAQSQYPHPPFFTSDDGLGLDDYDLPF